MLTAEVMIIEVLEQEKIPGFALDLSEFFAEPKF